MTLGDQNANAISQHYCWIPPVAKAGDRVECRTLGGEVKGGGLVRVDTNYTEAGVAFHTYLVDFGRAPHRRVAEERIVRVLSSDQPMSITKEPLAASLKYVEAISGDVMVSPEMQPVSASEISEYACGVAYPADLVECWLQIGCGFLSRNREGVRLTSFQNRLMGPDEIQELGECTYSIDHPYDVAIPFFDIADMSYLLMKHDGAIIHENGDFIANNLEVFLYDLVRSPEFWVRM